MHPSTNAWRREDLRLLRGQGSFLDDLEPEGTLHVALVRSPYAHAELRGIDVQAALAIPGVRAVVTWDDLGSARCYMDTLVPHPALVRPYTYGPLAHERVRYVGEPIAAVIADDRYIAEDGVDVVLVDYAELPVVSGLGGAVASDSALLYPDALRNCIAAHAQTVGDPAGQFASAPLKLQAELWIARGSGQPMETRGVLAEPQPDGSLTVWDSTQAPHRVRSAVAKLLGRTEASIRVIAPDTGGGFGSKGNLYPEELLVPFLAQRLGRPVKWVEDRREHLISAAQDREQCHRVELALAEDGMILAFRDHFDHDMGAYAPYGLVVPQNTLVHLSGTYRIPHLDVGFRAIVTNRPPTAPVRGAGRPQANYVVERTLDLAARRFGFDPVKLRERNLIRPDEMPYDTGLGFGAGKAVYDSGDYRAAYAEACRALDIPRWRAEKVAAGQSGRYIGIGVVPYLEACGGPGFEGARVELRSDGHVSVATGATPQGQGQETMLAGVVAQAMGVPAAAVVVTTGDTGAIAKGVGSFASRSTIAAGSAAHRAALVMRERCLLAAADLLRCPVDDLQLWDGRIQRRGCDDPDLTLLELYQAVAAGRCPMPPGGWVVEEYFTPGQMAFAHGAQGCVVEIRSDTAELKILQHVIVHDCGTVLQPQLVDGQVMGALAHGLGSMLYERLVYDANGQPLAGSLMDYQMPLATDMPPVDLYHLESPSPINPLGAKGAGEGGSIPVHSVLAQAIEDALSSRGVEVTTSPITPDQLFQWLHHR